MLVEVIKQKDLHGADYENHKYYTAFFNNFSVSNMVVLKTSIDSTDDAVIENLNEHCKWPNVYGHRCLISLQNCRVADGFIRSKTVYMDTERIKRDKLTVF